MRAAWLAAIALGSTAMAAGQQPVFRATTDAVTVDVSVRSGNRVITGLRPADFEILDNDVPQEVVDASYEKLPIDVTVALDVSASVSGELLDQLRTSVRQLVADLARQDRLRLITFNHQISRVFDFTADLAAVGRAVKQVTASGGTSLIDTIAVALVSASDPARRQLVVVFSDGLDSQSFTDESVMTDVARRGNATVYVVRSLAFQTMKIGVSQTPVQVISRVPPRDPPLLFSVTGETGGRVVPVAPWDSDVASTFRRVLSEFRSCYVLRFTPRGVDRGGYHVLTVRVRRTEQLEVRARRGYFGG